MVTDQFCWITLHLNWTGRGLKDGKMAIILNIFVKGGRLFEEGD